MNLAEQKQIPQKEIPPSPPLAKGGGDKVHRPEACATNATPAQRAAWIYYQMKLQGITAAAIGRRMRPRVSKVVMSLVINGKRSRVSPELARRIKAAVARALGMSLMEVWGEEQIPPGPPLVKGGEGLHRPEACATDAGVEGV